MSWIKEAEVPHVTANNQSSISTSAELHFMDTRQLYYPAVMAHFNNIQEKAGTAREQPNEHNGGYITDRKKKGVSICSKHCLPAGDQRFAAFVRMLVVSLRKVPLLTLSQFL